MVTLTIGHRYLFDTCVFIDILRNREPAKTFYYQTRFQSIFVGYSLISETELWKGITGLRTEEQHLKILKVYHRYFLNVTIARDAGKYWRQFYHQDGLKGGDLPSMEDCIIAATASFYGLRLLTSNSRHMLLFEPFGITVDIYTAN